MKDLSKETQNDVFKMKDVKDLSKKNQIQKTYLKRKKSERYVVRDANLRDFPKKKQI